MKCHVEYADGEVAVVERTPECGEDFCDSCGDCLACFGWYPCGGRQGHRHLWIKYDPSNGRAETPLP